jgi:hypothetical protein
MYVIYSRYVYAADAKRDSRRCLLLQSSWLAPPPPPSRCPSRGMSSAHLTYLSPSLSTLLVAGTTSCLCKMTCDILVQKKIGNRKVCTIDNLLH